MATDNPAKALFEFAGEYWPSRESTAFLSSRNLHLSNDAIIPSCHPNNIFIVPSNSLWPKLTLQIPPKSLTLDLMETLDLFFGRACYH